MTGIGWRAVIAILLAAVFLGGCDITGTGSGGCQTVTSTDANGNPITTVDCS